MNQRANTAAPRLQVRGARERAPLVGAVTVAAPAEMVAPVPVVAAPTERLVIVIAGVVSAALVVVPGAEVSTGLEVEVVVTVTAVLCTSAIRSDVFWQVSDGGTHALLEVVVVVASASVVEVDTAVELESVPSTMLFGHVLEPELKVPLPKK